MGAGRRFRMSLETECRLVSAFKSLQGTIKQRNMGYPAIGRQGYYNNVNERTDCALFDFELKNGEYYGEDYTFCNLYKKRDR